ncbi:MAG: dihydrofolate reductase family protein [Microthrixaceae bacterium]|nr:dihydrofolate reductase family protein [Microthrixaceae bacterium]
MELLQLNGEKLDIHELVGELTAQGAQRITCEGGPSLLGQLAASSLIDEYLLTLSPVLLGGTDVGLLGGTSVGREEYALHRVLRRADHLMCSFRRR